MAYVPEIGEYGDEGLGARGRALVGKNRVLLFFVDGRRVSERTYWSIFNQERNNPTKKHKYEQKIGVLNKRGKFVGIENIG
jgi:hypothetical protein